jgi:cation transport regulator ChaC
MQTSAQWDHELGTWKDRAPSLHLEDYKSPLYIFGYGSLIWRPGEFLSNFPSFPATATKCKRLFAQKSLDHRGNNKFPGLVLNLVKDDYLHEKGYTMASDCINQESSSSEDCFGLVWLVPDNQISEVIAYLDYREKGGYSRHYIHVKLQQDTPHYSANSIIDAVVYTGLEDNPNFFLPKLTPSVPNHGFSDLHFRSVVVDIIAAAKGLSGTNVEYLLKLQRYLEERNMADTYINRLAAAVRMRLGSWRRQSIISNILAAIPSTVQRQINEAASNLTLIGCGSNEFHQLHNENDGLETVPKDVSYYVRHAFHDLPGFANVDWIDTERHTILAAGANSAYLYEGRFAMWGSLARSILQSELGAEYAHEEVLVIDGVEGAALGYDSVLLLLSCGWVATLGAPLSNAPSSFVLPNDAFRLRLRSDLEQKDSKAIFASEKPRVPPSHVSQRFVIDILLEDMNSKIIKPAFQVVKLALGLKLAAAITHCGGLLVWGVPQTTAPREVNVPWYPPPPVEDFYTKNSTDCSSTSNSHLSKCVDVACGAYHVVVVDDEGRVFAHADPKYKKKMQRYGSLGDCLPLRQEDSDYVGRDSFHQAINTPPTLPRGSISEGASSSFPRSISWTSFIAAAASSPGSSTPTGSLCQQQLKVSLLGPSVLTMNQVLLPTDVRFFRATVGSSHTIVRGLKRCGEVVCYAWGRQDMSQYQVVSSDDTMVSSTKLNSVIDGTDSVTLQIDSLSIVENSTAPVTLLSSNSFDAPENASISAFSPPPPSLSSTSFSSSTVETGRARTMSSALSLALSNPNAATSTVPAAPSQPPLPPLPSSECTNDWHRPKPLIPLPNQRTFAEVWCGSEFTIAMDAETGSLWAMGWNEHGNLGIAPDENSFDKNDDLIGCASTGGNNHIISEWRLIQQNETKAAIQVAVFDGSVACGGAHFLCLQRPAATSSTGGCSTTDEVVRQRSHSSAQ